MAKDIMAFEDDCMGKEEMGKEDGGDDDHCVGEVREETVVAMDVT
jgi:hypothetical protein